MSTVEVGVRLAFAPAGLVELGPFQPRAGIGRQRQLGTKDSLEVRSSTAWT